MKPSIEARLSTHPEPCASRTSPAARVPYTTGSTFARKYFSKPSGRVSMNGARNGATPALFTMTSRRPSSATVVRTSARTASSSVTSVGTTSARLRKARTSSAADSSSATVREATATSAPACASASAIARPEVSHAMDNVRRNIGLLHEGDPDKLFGLTGLAEAMTPEAILELVGRASGFTPDPEWRTGPVPVDPDLVLDACEAVGDLLAEVVRTGGSVILATGHPTGLAHLYIEVGRLLRTRGVQVIQPYEAVSWREPGRHHHWEVRYLEGVAMLTDGASMKHTHSDEPIARMLAEQRPDLVFADHGFAGGAGGEGGPPGSVPPPTPPALLVAQAQGRTEIVIVMDDNVRPEDYWPCFQAIAARVP